MVTPIQSGRTTALGPKATSSLDDGCLMYRSFDTFRMSGFSSQGWISETGRPNQMIGAVGQAATVRGFLGEVAARTMNPAEKAATVNTINGN